MGIAQKDRIRILGIEIGQQGFGLGVRPILLQGHGQKVIGVVADVARMRLRPLEGFGRTAQVVILQARVAQDQPGQRPGVFSSMFARVSLHTGVGGCAAILK